MCLPLCTILWLDRRSRVFSPRTTTIVSNFDKVNVSSIFLIVTIHSTFLVGRPSAFRVFSYKFDRLWNFKSVSSTKDPLDFIVLVSSPRLRSFLPGIIPNVRSLSSIGLSSYVRGESSVIVMDLMIRLGVVLVFVFKLTPSSNGWSSKSNNVPSYTISFTRTLTFLFLHRGTNVDLIYTVATTPLFWLLSLGIWGARNVVLIRTCVRPFVSDVHHSLLLTRVDTLPLPLYRLLVYTQNFSVAPKPGNDDRRSSTVIKSVKPTVVLLDPVTTPSPPSQHFGVHWSVFCGHTKG